MTKVQLNPVSTPSEKIIENEKSALESQVVDADGKVYKLRVLDPLEELDMYSALGKDQGMNPLILSMVVPMYCIESINGEQFQKPGNYNEIRAAIKRIGRNGLKAVSKAWTKFSESQMEDNTEELKK